VACERALGAKASKRPRQLIAGQWGKDCWQLSGRSQRIPLREESPDDALPRGRPAADPEPSQLRHRDGVSQFLGSAPPRTAPVQLRSDIVPEERGLTLAIRSGCARWQQTADQFLPRG